MVIRSIVIGVETSMGVSECLYTAQQSLEL